jgi:hypothetical protein
MIIGNSTCWPRSVCMCVFFTTHTVNSDYFPFSINSCVRSRVNGNCEGRSDVVYKILFRSSKPFSLSKGMNVKIYGNTYNFVWAKISLWYWRRNIGWRCSNIERWERYEEFPKSKDISRLGRQGNFYAYYGNTAVDLDPLSVRCAHLTVVEPVFVSVRRVWNGSANPKSHQIRGAFRHTISQRKRWTSSGNLQTNYSCFW